MKLFAACATVLLTFLSLASAADRDKAEKQIRMITAMSRDETARSIVSHALADTFNVSRPQLVQQRKTLGLSYGNLFLARELAGSGAKFEDIAAQLSLHKTVPEIAAASHADWKRIAADAKKLNNRINDDIYRHFLHTKADESRDKAEHYTASADLVRADLDTTREELLIAQRDFVFWRDQAAPLNRGQADPSSPMGQAYQKARETMEENHGDTTSTSINH